MASYPSPFQLRARPSRSKFRLPARAHRFRSLAFASNLGDSHCMSSGSTTISSSSATTRAIDDDASQILEQRRASERYFQNNYYLEWAEVYRNMKARVQPLMRKDDK